MVDLNTIRRAETDLDFWRDKSLYFWRRYIRNLKIIRRLREQNRTLRVLLSDYVSAELQGFYEREQEIERREPGWSEDVDDGGVMK